MITEGATKLTKTYNPIKFQIGAGIQVCQTQSGLFFLIFGTFSEYMNFKNNDLYKFKQSTKDLKHANSSHISALKNFLQSDVRQWLQNVTGIELNQEIDLFCAKYRYVIYLKSMYISRFRIFLDF